MGQAMEGQSMIPPVTPAGGGPASATPAAASPQSVRPLVYDGRLGEIYRIFIVNFLLGLVTLGIYRFWGKTRLRRYLWSHTAYDGDRFEYTGTGGELFRGFLIVAVVLVAIGLGLVMTDLLLNIVFKDEPLKAALISQGFTMLVYVVFGYLLMVGQYMALRYRLSRSRWRGIRAGLAGSPWKYGIAAFAWLLAVFASLGFAKPVADMALARWRLRHLFFGTAQVKLDPDPGTGGLYGPYVASWFAMAGGFLVFYGVLIAMIVLNLDLFAQAETRPGTVPDFEAMLGDPRVQRLVWQAVLAVLLVAVPAWIFAMFVRCWYATVLLRRIAGMAELAGVRLRTTFGTTQLWWLTAGNLLIVIFTLGLGQPIVLHRIARFAAARIELVGALDGAAISQSQLAVPGRGEGLLEALDAGGAF